MATSCSIACAAADHPSVPDSIARDLGPGAGLHIDAEYLAAVRGAVEMAAMECQPIDITEADRPDRCKGPGAYIHLPQIIDSPLLCRGEECIG